MSYQFVDKNGNVLQRPLNFAATDAQVQKAIDNLYNLGKLQKSELSRKLKGKKIVFLGDSIHAYAVPDGITIPYYIQYHTEAECYNFAQGGTTMATMGVANYDPYCCAKMVDALVDGDFTDQEFYQEDRSFTKQVAAMKELDFSTVEYIVIEFGTNDCLKAVPLDNEEDIYDISTTGGALRYSIKRLLTYNPKLIILVCNVQAMSGYLDAEHQKPYTSDSQNNVIENILETYSIPLIDIKRKLGLNQFTSSTLLTDGLHRSRDGKLKQVSIIENVLDQNS